MFIFLEEKSESRSKEKHMGCPISMFLAKKTTHLHVLIHECNPDVHVLTMCTLLINSTRN